jgi:hypothetical protein
MCKPSPVLQNAVAANCAPRRPLGVNRDRNKGKERFSFICPPGSQTTSPSGNEDIPSFDRTGQGRSGATAPPAPALIHLKSNSGIE